MLMFVCLPLNKNNNNRKMLSMSRRKVMICYGGKIDKIDKKDISKKLILRGLNNIGLTNK